MIDTNIKAARGRPRKLDPQAGLDQATKLFLQFGFELVSVNDLCQALGVPATSIYSTYGNKQQLFETVLKRYTEQFLAGYDTALSSAKEYSQLFRITLEFCADFYLNHNQNQGCLLLQSCTFSKHPEVLRIANERQQELQSNIINRMTEMGAENANELADVLLHLMHGLAARIRAGADEDEVFTSTEFFCTAFDC